jgi:crotonobetainyl-CoA:carnitine CoA-transferase CaiB-like acyl-CoA transferase
MAATAKPLAGLRIIGMEQQVAGPYCTMMLADQGADVIKIERPGSGDSAREGAPIVRNEAGERASGYFLRFNRNKRSLTLNTQSEQGRAIFKRLAAQADVVVENFRPGLMARLGLDYETLRRDNPRLIYASISGFGTLAELQGPYSQRPAYDIVAQAMGGLMNTCGAADSPPTWLGVALGDIVSGMMAAQGILLALLSRATSGEGQYVDISMYDTMVALAERSVTAYSLTGRVLTRGREPYMAPWGPFETRDGAIALIVPTEGDWAKFCRAIGREDLLDDPALASGPGRAARMQQDLGPIIDGWMRQHSKAEVVETLLAAGLPVGPVQDAAEVFNCPHIATRELLIDVPDPVLGTARLVGSPIKLSESLEARRDPAPRLGEHTDAILRDLLGYDDEAIESLHQTQVV